MNGQAKQQALDIYLSEFSKQTDERIRFFIYGFFIFGLIIAPIYETWLFAIGVGGLCLALYFICINTIPGTLMSRMLISLIFAFYMLQFIGQMHGMYETHFFFFINIALLIIYRDWRIVLPYTLFAIAHHLFFFILQSRGYETGQYFINTGTVTWITLVFHFGLAALMALVCGWWAIVLNNQAKLDFNNQYELELRMESVDQNIQFAEEISKGNFDFNTNTIKANDELGNALTRMREGLSLAFKREQQDKFITTGINGVSEILRTNSNNLDTLANELIKGIIKYMNLNQGGLFLLEGETDAKHLRLVACYAYDRKKFLQKRVEIGEGLIGQCFLEKDIIYLKDVPTDYIQITSGLGDAPPTIILLAPIQTQDEIVGVLELASFNELDEYIIEFVKKICTNIASSVVSVKTTERVRNLLESSKKQAEALGAQEEEMRQNIEKMMATQEEMIRKETDYITKIRQLEARQLVSNLISIN